jgi:hypothetical protein
MIGICRVDLLAQPGNQTNPNLQGGKEGRRRREGRRERETEKSRTW